MQSISRLERRRAEPKRRRKLGEIVAERMIAEIIHKGWPEGEVLGTEADYMERYRVSRAIFREAVRQLEWHGAAVMRRGAHGGLEVKAPPRSALIFSIKAYFTLTRVSPAAQQEAGNILRPTFLSQAPNEVSKLFLDALDQRTMASVVQEASAQGKMPKLGEQIALRVIQDIEDAARQFGDLLGSETMLQRHYEVSRSTMRQALRQLELHGIVRVKTGANGGVFVHRVNPDYTVELADTYLHYARLPMSQLWQAQSALEIAAVGHAAHNCNPELLDKLRKAFNRLNDAAAGHYLTSANLFHQILGDASGNKAIALFCRILLCYTSKAMPIPSPRALPKLKLQHAEIIEAITDHDAVQAQIIMADMFEQSRRWIAQMDEHDGVIAS